ncbi:MAG: cell division protein FtsL [Lachnospiraceae bacterium]|nr:cell division protein FtsL [Candidatus Merdinaster equi]
MAQTRLKGRYISGTAVRAQEWNDILRDDPVQRSHSARRNREKAQKMNFGTILLLSMAVAIAAVVLISYLGLQAKVTAGINNVSKLESELYTLKQENDEYETRIKGSIDLSEIKRIAITELGMNYAQDGQIITVEAGSDDYVRKFTNIP